MLKVKTNRVRTINCVQIVYSVKRGSLVTLCLASFRAATLQQLLSLKFCVTVVRSSTVFVDTHI